MPGEDIQSWSITAATNATADTLINWAEGQPRASVNNSARSMMAATAKDRNLRNGSITTGGTANAQTFTSGVTYTAVPTGLRVLLKIGLTNTGAATLNMDGIGDVAILQENGAALVGGELLLGIYAEFRYDGTNWILLNRAQTRASIYAAPFDALAYNGMQINGSMDVSQELGTAGRTTNGYVCDGWRIDRTGTMVYNAVQNPSSGFFPPFSSLVYIATTTQQAVLGAGDLQIVTQLIEGYRIARLGWGTANAQSLAVGFWTAHHRTGTYSVSIRNGANNRSYVTTYTQNVADVSEFKTITIVGDTSGTWTSDNTTGLSISFPQAAGTTFTASSANAWTSGNFLAAPGQVNAVAALTDIFRITGVVVLPGSDAPTAARSPLIMRPYDQELTMCKRYYYNGILPLKGVTGGSQPWAQRMGHLHPVSMRAVPTVIIPATINFLDGTQLLASAGVATNYSTLYALEVDCQTAVVSAAGRGMVVSIGGSSGTITVDARL